jgi:hypothetical protein
MIRCIRTPFGAIWLRLLGALLVSSLAGLARADELSSPVRDEAKLFHASAVQKAKDQIQAIERDFGQVVRIETVKDTPRVERRWYRYLVRRQEINLFLDDRVRQMAQDDGRPGVYILLCKAPADARVLPWPEDAEPLFRLEDIGRLRERLIRSLKEYDPDQGLLDTLDRLRFLLQAHKDGSIVPVGVSGWLLGGVVGGAIGLWALLVLVQLKLRILGVGGPEEADLELRVALLGALFGSVAAWWLYDRLWSLAPRSEESLAQSQGESAQANAIQTHEKAVM